MDVGSILSLIGGLGLFLYGMDVMSDSIEKAAGAKMRGFLNFFTKNRFMGLLKLSCFRIHKLLHRYF